MTRIQSVLVANRGEIALRIMRTCRRMGIDTVAVFSDADADAPHVRFADRAVRIGPPAATDSYLNIDKVLDAAARAGADAIHPGYGFLAENAAFADAVVKAGLTFIGPSAEVIRVLGSKRESKRIVADAGVPVIPGDGGADQSVAALAAAARKIGFPVLIKASAGGGGKGMRVLRADDGLEAAIESAKRESASSFGDDTLLIEKYVDDPRHVEIQILGDSHGNVVHLFERECSIQRRHQKIVEESPSPAVTPELRAKMGAAAVAVANAVGYTNAGTVEFILAPDGAFYFLEVNTRLQVEHPVTECITGVDLVREQIRVAQGEQLAWSQDDLAIDGAAIEVRLYAEDPDSGFLPTSGRVVDWHAPDGDGLRIDAGLDGPADVSIYYDPMLAKVIAHAPTRSEAIRRLRHGLGALCASGITTNRAFLRRVLAHPRFESGEVDTHFCERHADELRATPPADAALHRAGALVAIADAERRAAVRTLLPSVPAGFRNNRFADQRVDYAFGDREVAVRYHRRADGAYQVGDAVWRVVAVDDANITVEDDTGLRTRARVVGSGDRWFVRDGADEVSLVEQPRFPDPTASSVEGGCTAPMPGAVVKVLVSEGQTVEAGQTLVILEAMKMEHAVKAATDGTVEQLLVSEGDQVDTDQVLAVVT